MVTIRAKVLTPHDAVAITKKNFKKNNKTGRTETFRRAGVFAEPRRPREYSSIVSFETHIESVNGVICRGDMPCIRLPLFGGVQMKLVGHGFGDEDVSVSITSASGFEVCDVLSRTTTTIKCISSARPRMNEYQCQSGPHLDRNKILRHQRQIPLWNVCINATPMKDVKACNGTLITDRVFFRLLHVLPKMLRDATVPSLISLTETQIAVLLRTNAQSMKGIAGETTIAVQAFDVIASVRFSRVTNVVVMLSKAVLALVVGLHAVIQKLFWTRSFCRLNTKRQAE
jgi:hypothetical protein